MNNIRFEKEWDELCPIYIKSENVFAQIGTGVLIGIFKNTYLLTAAHVIDELYKSKDIELQIPTIDGFNSISGTLYHRHLKKDENRDNDKVDFSFYKLSSELVAILHDYLIPLTVNQIDCSSNYVVEVKKPEKRISYKDTSKLLKSFYKDEDIGSSLNSIVCDITIIFAGFPNSKSKQRGDIYQTEIVYYHGRGVSLNEYKDNMYDETLNILAEHGKHGVMDKEFNSKNAPKPQGISGGGVYRIIKTSAGFERLLIGIGHTYEIKKHLFVGTNINFCIDVIKKATTEYDN